MKRITKQVQYTREEVTYVAVDGKVFDNEDHCKEYEKSYKCIVSDAFKKMNAKEINGTDWGIPYASEDSYCYAVLVKDMQDATMLNSYIQCVTNSDGTYITCDHIGEVVLLNFGYDHDYCDVWTPKGIINQVSTNLENFLKEINLSEE